MMLPGTDLLADALRYVRGAPGPTPSVRTTVGGREVHQTAPMRRSSVELLPEVAELDRNFDPSRREAYLAEGWYVDTHRTSLGTERPGPPAVDGPFARARERLTDYEHVDPAIVRAAWFADEPLEGRDMVLEGRFGPLRFPMALRVTGVRDERGDLDRREVVRWGWGYDTLEGHLERGRMDFEVRKDVASGEVTFHVDAWSQRAPLDNPVVALGMLVFGRTMQHLFGRAALDRMAALVRQPVDGLVEVDR